MYRGHKSEVGCFNSYLKFLRQICWTTIQITGQPPKGEEAEKARSQHIDCGENAAGNQKSWNGNARFKGRF